jgi:hypothetical protein
MGRSLRLEYAGVFYHITSRGDRREDIYDDDIDRAEFLVLLKKIGCHLDVYQRCVEVFCSLFSDSNSTVHINSVGFC